MASALSDIPDSSSVAAPGEEPKIHQGEVVKHEEVATPLKIQQVMKQYRLKKETRGVRVDLDEDLHTELKILCIRMGKTQEEFLIELISNAVKRKLEK